jgi:hypothetical protein
MTYDAEGLKLYVDNDADLYRQMTTQILRNLVTKMACGEYELDRAVEAWMHLADAGARKLTDALVRSRERPVGTPWHALFPVAVRRQTARDLARDFEAEADLGNYNELLPEKYKALAGSGSPRRIEWTGAGAGATSKKSDRQLKREVDHAVGGVSPGGGRRRRKT